LSHVDGSVDCHGLTDLVTKAVVSLIECSDGLSSSVEGEPLLSVGWIIIFHSESVLVCSNVFMIEQGSVSVHS